jgi:steroid 5-alpha reductase family enzyme
MHWDLLLTLYITCAILCAVGFYKFVYFLSIGYGFAVAGGGIAVLTMALSSPTATPIWISIIQAILFFVYGARLAGFLLVREFNNVTFKKTDVAKETLDKSEKKNPPIFVLVFIWIFVAALYVTQVSPMLYRYTNGAKDVVVPIIGFAISIFGLVLESVADKQKSEQKKENPNFVATKKLYSIVRCPNYLGEIIFWTGVFISGVTAYQTAGQWIIAIVAYVCIVYIMFNGAQRLEKRQMERYGSDPAYNEYADKTPIILPLVPLYHLNKK